MGNGTTAPAAAGGSKALSNHVSKNARTVYKFLAESPQGNEGAHVSVISQGLGMPQTEVFKAGDELLAEGVIYTTVDDETWSVLEF